MCHHHLYMRASDGVGVTNYGLFVSHPLTLWLRVVVMCLKGWKKGGGGGGGRRGGGGGGGGGRGERKEEEFLLWLSRLRTCSERTRVPSLALLSGLRIPCCCGCGAGR